MSSRIDFRELKARVPFHHIIERYGLTVRLVGGSLVGLCPFHEEEHPSFYIQLERGTFHCFGCGSKGSILDFVAKKEALSIPDAAELIASWFETVPRDHTSPEEQALPAQSDNGPPAPASVAPSEGSPGNPPLSFTLTLTPDHPYLVSRGVDRELAEYFGVGFSEHGPVRGRIAIPLHDEGGSLVGYLSRYPGDDLPEGEPRYRFPRGFRKSEILYNLHRVREWKHLVLVEGCFSVFRLRSLGVPAVALLGSSLSPRQEALLMERGVLAITLLLDGDPPGRRAAAEILPRLSRRHFVRVAILADGEQPDTVPEDTLRLLVRTGARA